MNDVYVTVNTPAHEYEYISSEQSLDAILAAATVMHEDWTSVTLIVVRNRLED